MGFLKDRLTFSFVYLEISIVALMFLRAAVVLLMFVSLSQGRSPVGIYIRRPGGKSFKEIESWDIFDARMSPIDGIGKRNVLSWQCGLQYSYLYVNTTHSQVSDVDTQWSVWIHTWVLHKSTWVLHKWQLAWLQISVSDGYDIFYAEPVQKCFTTFYTAIHQMHCYIR